MKALCKVAHGPGNMEIVEVPKPECGPEDILIEVKAAGICGSDLQVIDWSNPKRLEHFPTPCVLGHEFAGVIAEIGERVTGYSVGERVVSDNTGDVCGECYHCLRGAYTSCEKRQGLGYYLDGGFTKYVKIKGHVLRAAPASLWKIPEEVSMEAATMMDPACNGYRAVITEGQVRPGDTVVIFGTGTIGLCCIQAARAAGAARIYAICTRNTPVRTQMALQLGADEVLETTKMDVVRYVREKTKGEGVPVVVDASGRNESIHKGIDMARNGGKVILFGYDARDFGSLDPIIDRGISLVGHFAYGFEEWNAVFELLKVGKYQLDPLVTHQLPLEDWEKGVAMMKKREAIKVVLKP